MGCAASATASAQRVMNSQESHDHSAVLPSKGPSEATRTSTLPVVLSNDCPDENEDEDSLGAEVDFGSCSIEEVLRKDELDEEKLVTFRFAAFRE